MFFDEQVLIGISAKKQSGKDEFFKVMNELNNDLFENKKFASKLKQICSLLTGLPIEYFYNHEYYDYSLSNWKLTIRQMQQKIGTELFRNNFSENIWIDSLFCDFKKDSKWIITDVRFPNELQSIRAKKGIIVRIERESVKDNDNHASETSLDGYTNWDYIIYNNSTLEDYRKEIIKFDKIIFNK